MVDGNGGSESLPSSIARAWRTFDVAKQIEYETKEKAKAEKAEQQKIMQVCDKKHLVLYFCGWREAV